MNAVIEGKKTSIKKKNAIVQVPPYTKVYS